MRVDLYQSISKSKSHTTSIKLNKETYKIRNIITSSLNKNFDFSNKELSKLNRNELKEISAIVSTKKKKEIVNILYPIIKSQISNKYLKLNKKIIRPSLQCKYIWSKKDENYSRKTFYKNNVMYESKSKENFCFPTRPHQDFENNGFRSLNTIIFYFQLTKVNKNSCDLKVANFIGKPSLLEYKNQWNYQNQFSKKCNESLKWITPKNLNKDHVVIMDALTPHASDLGSKIPRLAINVKLHPTNNDFLFENKFLRYFKGNRFSNQKKIAILKNYLIQNLNKRPEFLLELAILEYFFGELKASIEFIRSFCSFKISKTEAYKILTGMILKKNLFQINKKDINNLKNNRLVINDLSFAKRSLDFLKS